MFAKDWRLIDFSFGLVYPNVRKIGMSSYAMRLLYYLINSYNNIACERIFLPEKIKYPAHQFQDPKNRIKSDLSRALLEEFDVLGFSIQFENDFKNILWILEDALIPITTQAREIQSKENENPHPLIIGGGPVVTSNPIPFGRFFDFLFIGDAEPNLDLFLKLIPKYTSKEISYQDLVKQVQQIEGIFIPSINNKVKRVVQQNLSQSITADHQDYMESPEGNKIFGNNYFIEINRGCPYNCNFCISSYHNSPFRNRSFEKIIESIDKGIKSQGFNLFSMIGACVAAHPRFEDICRYILEKGKKFTVPSIRIEYINSKILRLLEESNIRTITIAPETGSEKLRYGMGKNISNQQIYSVIKEIKESQIQNVKFYFLIGLPNEAEEDIRETIKMIKDFNEIGFGKGALRVNINPMIPKLNTPYENEVDFFLMENVYKLRNTLQMIEKELKNLPSIKLKFQNIKSIIKNARLQTLISLGDKETSQLLEDYYMEGANFGALRRVENRADFNIQDYYIKIKNGYSPWRFNSD